MLYFGVSGLESEIRWKKEVPIFRANGAFMGIFVPKGEHQIELRYDPDVCRIGSYFSLITLFGLVFGVSLKITRERSK